MNTIVYIGMDVHKESYTLCYYSYDTDKVEYKQTIPADYKLILKYMEQVRKRYDGEVTFVCGYEAGCEDKEFVKEISSIAEKYLPNYDAEKIYKEWRIVEKNY